MCFGIEHPRVLPYMKIDSTVHYCSGQTKKPILSHENLTQHRKRK